MKLSEFVTSTKDGLDKFQEAYNAKHLVNPDDYPLSLEEDNSGLWLEMLMIFLDTGEA